MRERESRTREEEERYMGGFNVSRYFEEILKCDEMMINDEFVLPFFPKCLV